MTPQSTPRNVTTERIEVGSTDDDKAARLQGPPRRLEHGARREQVLDGVEHHGEVECSRRQARRLGAHAERQPVSRERRARV